MSRPQGARVSNRNALLDAVEAILKEGYAHDVTLENVAARAGVTKGGLVYHFKSREALFLAVVERMKQRRTPITVSSDLSPQQQLQVLLEQKIHAGLALDPVQKKLLANLLTAATSYPDLMPSLRGLYEDGLDDLAKRSDQPGLALAIRSALDGIMLLELLNLRQFSAEEKDHVRRALLDMARQPQP